MQYHHGNRIKCTHPIHCWIDT